MKAQYADFSKEQTVLIGDTHYDADGAKEGGIDCIGVGYGFGAQKKCGTQVLWPYMKTRKHCGKYWYKL